MKEAGSDQSRNLNQTDPHPNLVICPIGSSAAQPRLSPCLQLWVSNTPAQPLQPKVWVSETKSQADSDEKDVGSPSHCWPAQSRDSTEVTANQTS